MLESAGLPDGYFMFLPGGPETGAALVKEHLIDMISFTGRLALADRSVLSRANNSNESLLSLVVTIPISCWTTWTFEAQPALELGSVLPSGTNLLTAGAISFMRA